MFTIQDGQPQVDPYYLLFICLKVINDGLIQFTGAIKVCRTRVLHMFR